MTYTALIQNISNVTVTECEGSFLITVSNSHDAEILLERVIKQKAHCWIGIRSPQTEHTLSIYAAYPIQMWGATVSAQAANH